MFFEPRHDISRVIFMASPFKGSKTADMVLFRFFPPGAIFAGVARTPLSRVHAQPELDAAVTSSFSASSLSASARFSPRSKSLPLSQNSSQPVLEAPGPPLSRSPSVLQAPPMPLTGPLSNAPPQAATLSHPFPAQKQILVFNGTWSTRLPFFTPCSEISAGRKDFLPVEPQGGLSFLFRLSEPRFA
jgi:hypothetical protein